MGAAGRDFHNFLCVFRNNHAAEVIAFTAAQIPGIATRRFPAVASRRWLAGWCSNNAGALVVDPRPWAGPELRQIFADHPHLGPVLPALGCYPAQLEALRDCIEHCDAEFVVNGSPIDLASLLQVDKPVLRARYHYADLGKPGLAGVLREFLRERNLV